MSPPDLITIAAPHAKSVNYGAISALFVIAILCWIAHVMFIKSRIVVYTAILLIIGAMLSNMSGTFGDSMRSVMSGISQAGNYLIGLASK